MVEVLVMVVLVVVMTMVEMMVVEVVVLEMTLGAMVVLVVEVTGMITGMRIWGRRTHRAWGAHLLTTHLLHPSCPNESVLARMRSGEIVGWYVGSVV